MLAVDKAGATPEASWEVSHISTEQAHNAAAPVTYPVVRAAPYSTDNHDIIRNEGLV